MYFLSLERVNFFSLYIGFFILFLSRSSVDAWGLRVFLGRTVVICLY